VVAAGKGALQQGIDLVAVLYCQLLYLHGGPR
jgi:hypothetical protein